MQVGTFIRQKRKVKNVSVAHTLRNVAVNLRVNNLGISKYTKKAIAYEVYSQGQ